jgi:UDP-N-acetylglucosamine 2-epimerase
MKIISIVGARPQFIKLAPICRALKNREKQIQHIIIHTGQHYDNNMSGDLFDELELPHPKYNLAIGSGTHAAQTGKGLQGIDSILIEEKPDHVIIFGDTNATLSAALAASKIGIPMSHIEAGLRSFNRLMPEEINRIVADKLSTYLFCPNEEGVKNLRLEGITNGVFNIGDVMVDQIYAIKDKKFSGNLPVSPFVFMTLHRQETSDSTKDLEKIIDKVNRLSYEVPVIFAIHPRMKYLVNSLPISYHSSFKIIDPLSYQKTIQHIKSASCVLTDSGGIQKESYILKTPCVTLRSETEWVETLEENWNVLVGLDPEKLERAFYSALNFDRNSKHRQVYGDGTASIKIVEKILKS